MSKNDVLRTLQEHGYRGRYVYIPRRHPDDELSNHLSKKSGILSDSATGLSKVELCKKYETSITYINKLIADSRKASSPRKRAKGIDLNTWKSVVEVFPDFKKTGGYLYIPVQTVRDDRKRPGSGLNGSKKDLIWQEFQHGNFNVKEIAEACDTTISYVYKQKFLFNRKKRGY